MKARRGGGIALIFVLMFALLTIALGTLAVVAASAAAVERDYRSSQALALAEGGLAAARATVPRAGAAAGFRKSRVLEQGVVEWDCTDRGTGSWEVVARGIVTTPRGVTIVRAVRAELRRDHGQWTIASWREERRQ
jgi:hypothetical protein